MRSRNRNCADDFRVVNEQPYVKLKCRDNAAVVTPVRHALAQSLRKKDATAYACGNGLGARDCEAQWKAIDGRNALQRGSAGVVFHEVGGAQ